MESTTNPAFTGWRSYTLVELPVMLFFFGQTVTGAVTSDLMLYRSCQFILGVDNKDCDLLHTNSSSQEVKDLNVRIQPYVSYILMYKSLVDGLVPAFLSFFLGPWSDGYGRKPLLVASYAGSALSFLFWSYLSRLKNLNPWLYLIASVPPALVGGYYSLILATYCYITDIRKEGDRAWHLTYLQAAISVGQLAGNFAGPAIFNKFGYPAVFMVASAGNLIATIYVLALVPESVNRSNIRKSWRSLFNFSLIKDMLVTCTKKREGFDRIIVWCCICSLAINMLIGEGELSIGFLFASARLSWKVDEYSLYMAVVVLLGIVGTLLGGKIFKTFVDKTMSDMLIAILASTSAFAGAMAKSFTRESWHLYLSTILAMLSGISGPVIRTALSKSVPPQDTGKVFSLTTSMEAIIPLASAPLYTMVYAHYMPPIYPSPVYLVSAGLNLFIIVIVITIDWRISKLIAKPVTAVDRGID